MSSEHPGRDRDPTHATLSFWRAFVERLRDGSLDAVQDGAKYGVLVVIVVVLALAIMFAVPGSRAVALAWIERVAPGLVAVIAPNDASHVARPAPDQAERRQQVTLPPDRPPPGNAPPPSVPIPPQPGTQRPVGPGGAAGPNADPQALGGTVEGATQPAAADTLRSERQRGGASVPLSRHDVRGLTYWIDRSATREEDEAAARPIEILLETQFGMIPASRRDSAALLLRVRFEVDTPPVPDGQTSLDRLYRARLTVRCEHREGWTCPALTVPAQRRINLGSRRDAVDALAADAVAEFGRVAWRSAE